MAGLINYVKKAFKNYPDTTTKISAENLNHLDNGIFNLDQAAGKLADDLDNFKFRNNSGTAQYSMNGGSTWANFKNPTGTKSITANGTYDVTDYASASVNVNTSPVEKVLRGTFNFNSNSASTTVYVPYDDTTRCQITIYGNGIWYGDTDNLGIYVQSLSNGYLTVNRIGGGNNKTSTFSYEIIQYKPNVVKRIIRKTFNIGNASSGTISLGTTIDPNKCHVTIHGVGGGNGYNVNNAGLYVKSINSTSIVVGDSAGFAHNYTHSLEIVEFY